MFKEILTASVSFLSIAEMKRERLSKLLQQEMNKELYTSVDVYKTHHLFAAVPIQQNGQAWVTNVHAIGKEIVLYTPGLGWSRCPSLQLVDVIDVYLEYADNSQRARFYHWQRN